MGIYYICPYKSITQKFICESHMKSIHLVSYLLLLTLFPVLLTAQDKKWPPKDSFDDKAKLITNYNDIIEVHAQRKEPNLGRHLIYWGVKNLTSDELAITLTKKYYHYNELVHTDDLRGNYTLYLKPNEFKVGQVFGMMGLSVDLWFGEEIPKGKYITRVQVDDITVRNISQEIREEEENKRRLKAEQEAQREARKKAEEERLAVLVKEAEEKRRLEKEKEKEEAERRLKEDLQKKADAAAQEQEEKASQVKEEERIKAEQELEARRKYEQEQEERREREKKAQIDNGWKELNIIKRKGEKYADKAEARNQQALNLAELLLSFEGNTSESGRMHGDCFMMRFSKGLLGESMPVNAQYRQDNQALGTKKYSGAGMGGVVGAEIYPYYGYSWGVGVGGEVGYGWFVTGGGQEGSEYATNSSSEGEVVTGSVKGMGFLGNKHLPLQLTGEFGMGIRSSSVSGEGESKFGVLGATTKYTYSGETDYEYDYIGIGLGFHPSGTDGYFEISTLFERPEHSWNNRFQRWRIGMIAGNFFSLHFIQGDNYPIADENGKLMSDTGSLWSLRFQSLFDIYSAPFVTMWE